MRSSIFPIHCQDQVGEPIDDSGQPAKIRCTVHHAEHSQPGCHPVEIPQLTFETTAPTLPNGPASEPSGRCGPCPEMNARLPRTRTHGKGNLAPGGSASGSGKI